MSFESDSAFHARQLFIQGSYSACISTVESIGSGVSSSLQLYAARSHIALAQFDRAYALVRSIGEDESAAQAVRILADSVKAAGSDGGAAADEAFELLEALGEDADGPTRAIAGTILAAQEDYRQQAIETLAAGSKQEDQECVALLVQLYLSLDRLDLAKQTYASAKVWAEDSLLIQLCEAWIGLKQGGEEDTSYQSAFYCYDEISQGPSANNPTVLNGKAVSQAALHRWPEAEAPLTEAAGIDSNHAATLANSAAIALLSGKPAGTSEQYLSTLRSVAPNFPLLEDLAAKEALFDEAAAKFSVSVSA